jgi:phenylalanyl-tRNA synthetase alpha chain
LCAFPPNFKGKGLHIFSLARAKRSGGRFCSLVFCAKEQRDTLCVFFSRGTFKVIGRVQHLIRHGRETIISGRRRSRKPRRAEGRNRTIAKSFIRGRREEKKTTREEDKKTTSKTTSATLQVDDRELEKRLLLQTQSDGEVDSASFASQHEVDPKRIVGIIKSLAASNVVVFSETDKNTLNLTEEAMSFIENGSPEARAFDFVKSKGKNGVSLPEFKKLEKTISEVGFKQAMQQKWLAMDKATNSVVAKVEEITDTCRTYLRMIKEGKKEEVPAKELDALIKKRKLAKVETWKEYAVKRGPEFALERKKLEHDLTKEMLANGAWKTATFKEYTLVPGAGNIPASGHVHPLLKVRRAFREIFLQLGFSEMPTNNFVESGFWNFDTLIQPQQHPARDAHDTFFMKTPAKANFAPEEYVEKVKKMHEVGGHGSVGHNYAWKREEADKNILRTHTTAVSARMLHKLAEDGFKPCKLFSIDRVFRNEAVDRTHLAEFHQVEGVVCDKGLTLGDLIGVIRQFFAQLGMTQVRFKPAFNPYTEPSMEIFAFHPMLGKWVEVGNSGMFRPEMLLPMGLPEDVSVIAWGLSLERPTMIMFGIDNIRDLFGSKMQLQSVKNNQLCPLGLEK